MPRRTVLIPAEDAFDAAYWNVAIYRPGVRSALFHDEIDLWSRLEGLEPNSIMEPAVGDPLARSLPEDIRSALREDVAMSRWGEFEPALDTATLEELVVVECITEPRTTQDGRVYGMLHLFVASTNPQSNGARE